MENLWSSIPIPAFIINRKNCIMDANPTMEGCSNLSKRHLVGQFIWNVMRLKDPLDSAILRVRRDGAPLFVNDIDIFLGEQFFSSCNLQIAPLSTDGDNLLIFIQPDKEIGRQGMSRTAAQSAMGMSDMLAHEIKNPLAGIAGAAQLLSMNLNAEDRELTDLIVTETQRIVSLLEKVEQFGQMPAPQLRSVNLHDILHKVKQSAQVGFGSHMICVEEYDPSLPDAMADPDQLVQVFMNLMKNAAEANPSGGEIIIRTFYDGALHVPRSDGVRQALPLQVEIQDDGPGLPLDISDIVFEPFVSGHKNGTGLGLAMVSKIISDHGGWIKVDSCETGTTFRISLAMADKGKN